MSILAALKDANDFDYTEWLGNSTRQSGLMSKILDLGFFCLVDNGEFR